MIGRVFEGAFGIAFVEQLFAEGPFLFTLYIAFLPVFFYLALGSVFKFGLEKKIGAIELLCYGPTDGTAYFMALILKDILITILSISILWVFFGFAALLNNLILGPLFVCSLPMLFFLAVTFYAYGILSSTCTEHSASAIALFLGVLVFFLILVLGKFTIVSGYVRSLSTVFSWLFKWFSPFFYWVLGLKALSAGRPGLFILSLLLLLILTGVILCISHIIFRTKGVRG
jgi:hypothetical protein